MAHPYCDGSGRRGRSQGPHRTDLQAWARWLLNGLALARAQRSCCVGCLRGACHLCCLCHWCSRDAALGGRHVLARARTESQLMNHGVCVDSRPISGGNHVIPLGCVRITHCSRVLPDAPRRAAACAISGARQSAPGRGLARSQLHHQANHAAELTCSPRPGGAQSQWPANMLAITPVAMLTSRYSLPTCTQCCPRCGACRPWVRQLSTT